MKVCPLTVSSGSWHSLKRQSKAQDELSTEMGSDMKAELPMYRSHAASTYPVMRALESGANQENF
eukprot:1276776-Amphidinium_carterae.1